MVNIAMLNPRKIMGKSKGLMGNKPTTKTIKVVNPILIKLITAEPCALSVAVPIATTEALAIIKQSPK